MMEWELIRINLGAWSCVDGQLGSDRVADRV